jgi:RHS repeat-associated protein
MGALRLTYNQREEALEKSSLFVVGALEVNGVSQKNRVRTYRYGFNGQERDNEWKGEGNSVAYEARIYDPRLGKMLSVDPWTDKYSWQTPYAYHRNSPIESVDWKGYGDGDTPNTLPSD